MMGLSGIAKVEQGSIAMGIMLAAAKMAVASMHPRLQDTVCSNRYWGLGGGGWCRCQVGRQIAGG